MATLTPVAPRPLALEGVSVRYGGVAALEGVSLRVEPGSVLGLIGPNGAGKTTLINATTGIVTPSAGAVRLAERALERLRPHEIARAGVVRTYQNIRLFGALSVRANMQAGAYGRPGRLDDDAVAAILARVGIADVDLGAPAGALPYGDQRRLEIARALAGRPAVLMLDEPAAGMNAVETRALGTTVRGLAAQGIGVLLIEHDMSLVRAVCDTVVVLNFGRVIASGTPASIGRDPAVIEAYLGSEAAP